MNLSKLQHAINWWKGSINIEHLERVLQAKEKPIHNRTIRTFKKLSISHTVNANK